MNEQVQIYLEKYPAEVVEMFKALRQLIFDSTDIGVKETLWAKLPSYYVGESFVRLIPFKDHINIETSAAIKYNEELEGYKITPKGMIQVYVKQKLPSEILRQIFRETLSD